MGTVIIVTMATNDVHFVFTVAVIAAVAIFVDSAQQMTSLFCDTFLHFFWM
jgi:hypothetical protein